MKAHVTLEAEQEVTLEWEGVMRTFDVAFTVEASASHTPAKVSGPPESCYPEDSEVELESINIDFVTDENADPMIPGEELGKKLLSSLNRDRIQELVWEAAWDEWNEPK